MNFYNVMSEDPKCMRPYPEDSKAENSVSASNGECVRMDDGYVKFNILSYDGRPFDYNSEWDQFKYKQWS